jgi:hypothetical protein
MTTITNNEYEQLVKDTVSPYVNKSDNTALSSLSLGLSLSIGKLCNHIIEEPNDIEGIKNLLGDILYYTAYGCSVIEYRFDKIYNKYMNYTNKRINITDLCILLSKANGTIAEVINEHLYYRREHLCFTQLIINLQSILSNIIIYGLSININLDDIKQISTKKISARYPNCKFNVSDFIKIKEEEVLV